MRMQKGTISAGLGISFAIFLTVTVLTGSAAHAAIIHPEYSKPILDPATQPHWVTPIPNALADYFTYTPYTSDAAAVAAGFPSGVCGNGTIQSGPLAGQPQEDCYSISVRQFQQDLGLKAEGSYVAGVSAGTPLLTSVWGYGTASNAPAVGPFTAGVWHFPAPTFKNTSNKPARITWANELPNTQPAGFDPSYDCGPNAPDCYPYNRIVTHVHGAHVADDSDGYATAWYSPLDPVTNAPIAAGPDYQPSKYGPPGTYRYENTQEAGTVWYHDHAMGSTHLNTNQGMAGFFPITDDNEKYLQGLTVPAASLPAGFAQPNPGPKLLPTGQYELGFALQDRNFWPDGSLAMPDLLIYNLLADSVNCSINPTTNVINPACPAVPFSKDAAGALIPYNSTIASALRRGPFTATGRPFAACTPDLVNGGVIPDTCPEVPFSKAADGHLIAYSPTAPVPGPFTASSGTLEYFGNIPVVNGVVFGKYDIEPRVYRMRFIGGTDSRAWIMQLQVRGTGNPAAVPPVPDTVIPFWQIATEQGFVKNPIMRNQMVLMPGERLDVLVDFRALTAGQKVVLANLGSDMPYGGELMLTGLLPAPRSLDIPEIMEFSVPTPLPAASGIPEIAKIPAAPAGAQDGYVDTTINLRPLDASPTFPPALPLTPQLPVRNVSLMEITDQYGRTMPTIDSRGFMPMGVPITEVVKLGDTEQWDIINSTVDSHPMHLHLVSFQLIDRVALPATLDPVTGLSTGFTPPVDDPMAYSFTPPSYVADPAIAPIPPAPWELGWKDTIECPPGYVTRVKAKFDIPGLYVWHCHILSHEEHDMMRPMVVTTPAGSVNLTASTATNSQLSGSVAPVTFTASALTTIPGYAETGGFEYQFTVTPPSGVSVTQPAIPANMTSMVGTTSGYFMSRQADWTPPSTPGTYTVTVNAKGLGPITSSNKVKSSSLNYIITGSGIAGVTSTTTSGVYRSGAKINITLTFNQTISSANGLTITLNSGATLSTGRMTNVSSFNGTYTVASGQDTPSGQNLDITAITGTVTDAAGNSVTALSVPSGANLSNSKQITIDTTPPALTVSDPTSTLVNAATQAVAGFVSDQNGIQSLKVNGSSVPVGSGGAFITTVSLVSGVNTISVAATDTAGNQTVVARSITLDTVKPVTTVTPAGGTYSGSVAVTLSVNKAGSTIYYTTDGSSPTTASTVYSGPVALAATTTTTYTVQYFAVDPAGNNESVKSVTFTVHVSDLTASVKINNGSALTKSAAVTLNLSATDPLGVTGMQVACDGTNFSAVEPYNVTRACTLPGADGVKNAAVKFIDSVGTVYAPVTAQITLDLTVPTLTITGPSSTLVNTPTVTVTGTVSDKNGIQSLTVNGTTATVGAGGAFSKDITLAGGANAITVIATDNAGNQVTRVRSITLDTVLPVTTVSPAPGTFTGNVTVSLASSKAGSTIYYTTNGTTPTTASPVYTGPIALSAAATTTYSMRYFAADQAGNIEAVKTADFTVHVSDLTAGVKINNGAQLTNSANITLNLAATDPAGVPSMQVACDGTTFGGTEPYATGKACTLPTGDGLKTVAVTFIDGVGNVYAPVTAQIILDTTPPVVSATPGTGVYAGAVSVELASNEPATIYYTTNGSAPTTASSVYAAPIQLGSPATAVLSLAFMAVDQAGNASAVQTVNYTIHQPDLSAAMTINGGASLTTSPSVTLSLTATDPTGVTEMQVACDGTNYAVAEPYAVTRACSLTSGDGLKTILAKFRDGLGNWYPSINAQITLDTTAPATSVSPAAGTYSNSVSVVLNASEASTIYYTTDGTDPVVGATPGPAVYTGSLTFSPNATTDYTVKYLAVDRAGNAEAVRSTTYTVHVNDLAGSILINGGAPYTAVAGTTLTLAATDPATVTEMQFSNDGVSYTPFEPYATTRGWALNGGDGVKTVYVQFKDGTGTVYPPYSAEITLSASAATTPIGDLNGDAAVSLADALRALQISVGLFQPTVNERVRGDVAPLAAGKPSPDGVIDSGDVLIILKRVLALTTW